MNREAKKKKHGSPVPNLAKHVQNTVIITINTPLLLLLLLLLLFLLLFLFMASAERVGLRIA